MEANRKISELSLEEKVNIIRANRLDWNQKRAEERASYPDGLEITEVDLMGADLSGANLAGVDLLKARLNGADLSQANVDGADLASSDLSQANLDGIKNWKTVFWGRCNIWGLLNPPEGFVEFVLSRRGVENPPKEEKA